MFLAIDVGGTKILAAVLDEHGTVLASQKTATPATYDELMPTLVDLVRALPQHPYRATCIAMPGRIDHATGSVIAMGNRDWQHVPVIADLRQAMPELATAPIYLHNDAKLAGLAEASLLGERFSKILYVTVGTGIGIAYVVHGVLDPELADEEGGQMLLPNPEGKLQTWEDFASGRAIMERYGKRADEITDQKIWQEIAAMLGVGIVNLCTILGPDVVIFGGGVGAHFGSFEQPLRQFVQENCSPLTPVPELVQAQNPEEAVLYGCYTYSQQQLAA